MFDKPNHEVMHLIFETILLVGVLASQVSKLNNLQRNATMIDYKLKIKIEN